MRLRRCRSSVTLARPREIVLLLLLLLRLRTLTDNLRSVFWMLNATTDANVLVAPAVLETTPPAAPRRDGREERAAEPSPSRNASTYDTK